MKILLFYNNAFRRITKTLQSLQIRYFDHFEEIFEILQDFVKLILFYDDAFRRTIKTLRSL